MPLEIFWYFQGDREGKRLMVSSGLISCIHLSNKRHQTDINKLRVMSCCWFQTQLTLAHYSSIVKYGLAQDIGHSDLISSRLSFDHLSALNKFSTSLGSFYTPRKHKVKRFSRVQNKISGIKWFKMRPSRQITA